MFRKLLTGTLLAATLLTAGVASADPCYRGRWGWGPRRGHDSQSWAYQVRVEMNQLDAEIRNQLRYGHGRPDLLYRLHQTRAMVERYLNQIAWRGWVSPHDRVYVQQHLQHMRDLRNQCHATAWR
jgi:hypothetical protein